MDLNEYIRDHPEESNRQIAQKFNVSTDIVRNRRNRMNAKKGTTVEEAVNADIAKVSAKVEKITTERKNKELIQRLREAEQARDIALGISPKPYVIKNIKSTGKSEAVAFMVASDWHLAEGINPENVNDMNEFNPNIARQRAESFFRNGLKLVEMNQHAVDISTLVVPLLGDLVNNTIHEDAVESNTMSQAEEVDFAESVLMSGFDYLLKNSNLKIIVPCSTGNHGRTTQDRRCSTENGNNLETILYHHLANCYRNEPRIEFIVAKGYLSYLNLFDKYLIRLHHGHNIRYAGGVGGIYIPLNKAINQWNKLRHAYIDVMGHFHQFRDGGNFIANGSLCGFNAFAISIKADYEEPRQAFFLIDKKRGKTIVAPILLNE